MTITLQDPPSMLRSYLAWRKNGLGTLPRPKHDDTCPICKGWLEIQTKEYGPLYCLCAVTTHTLVLDIQYKPFNSIANQDATLENLQDWGSAQSIDTIICLKDFFKSWIEWPTLWALIVGVPGCGKTHLLSALHKIFKPWSLYITSADFESKAFSATKGLEDYGIETFINLLCTVPILLYDDLGLEYGSEYITALFRKVIDFRYQKASELPTIITSNHDVAALYEWDPRITDRITDIHSSRTIIMKGVRSWRQRGNGK